VRWIRVSALAWVAGGLLATAAGASPAGADASTGPVSETWAYLKLLSLPDGTTDVRLDAVALWVPAPVAIPAGAKLVVAKATVLRGSPSTTTETIRSPARIEAVRRMIDRRPVSRPSLLVRSCPAAWGDATLDFYATRRARGKATAVVTLAIGGCGGTSLAVRGVATPERDGADLVRLAKLTGLRALRL
jgi:hypothetical protein